ncbi:Uncharacterised protein [uncultured archaeon]|nr:Uncharacterised protein [uncultured archaeon]
MVFTAKSQVKWYSVGIYRYLAAPESVLGWLLLALFLVTLVRTPIRWWFRLRFSFCIQGCSKYPHQRNNVKRREKSLYWFA